MATWEFPGSEPIEIFIEIASGSVAVSGEPGAAATVTARSSKHGHDDAPPPEELQVSFNDGRLEIVQPKSSSWIRGHASLDVTVKAPAGSSCTVRTASADVSCVGDLAGLEARTASGDVTATSVRDAAAVNTASGDVWLERVGGAVTVRTASGDVRLSRAGADVAVITASGDARIGTVGGSASVQTATGDVEIGSVRAGEANVKTVSGDTTVGVARGAEAYLDLSSLTGDISSQLEEAAGGEGVALRVICRSVSGDIQIRRAAATADAQ
jgi:Putative adhesin